MKNAIFQVTFKNLVFAMTFDLKNREWFSLILNFVQFRSTYVIFFCLEVENRDNKFHLKTRTHCGLKH